MMILPVGRSQNYLQSRHAERNRGTHDADGNNIKQVAAHSHTASAHSYPPPNNFGVNLPYRKLRKCCVACGAPVPVEAA
jgi:hypothetical protein